MSRQTFKVSCRESGPSLGAQKIQNMQQDNGMDIARTAAWQVLCATQHISYRGGVAARVCTAECKGRMLTGCDGHVLQLGFNTIHGDTLHDVLTINTTGGYLCRDTTGPL